MQLTEATISASRRSNNDSRRRKPQLVEFVVDGRFFFNKKIGGGNVSLGLVVVVIRNEIFDGIMRKEILELVIKLRGESFVMRHHQRRTVHRLNHLRHGVSFAGPGNTQQNLMLFAVVDAAQQRLDRAALIPLRLVIGNEFKVHESGF